MATQVYLAELHIADATDVPPLPAGPPCCSPLHLLQHISLSFIIGMPNRSCIVHTQVEVQPMFCIMQLPLYA